MRWFKLIVDTETGEKLYEKNILYREGEVIKVFTPKHEGR